MDNPDHYDEYPELTRADKMTSPTPSPISDQAAGEPRFFIDHGVIHDRTTGKHVTLSDDGDPEKGLAICCDLMNSLAAQTTISSDQSAGGPETLGYEPLDGPIREWQVLLQNALVREYDRTAEIHKATGKWDSYYMKIIGEHIARFPLLHATPVPTAPTTGSARQQRGWIEQFSTSRMSAVSPASRLPD